MRPRNLDTDYNPDPFRNRLGNIINQHSQHLRRVSVDTTVQEKAVSYPTDSKLLNLSRVRLVRLCRRYKVSLRQSFSRVGPDAHARQYRRLLREVRKLHTYLGRVVRDIERKIGSDPELQEVFGAELELARRLAQRKDDKNKLYSQHAPEVECIAKGKVHKRYEFGVKVSVAVTNKSNFVVGAMAVAGNPYDGNTLVGSGPWSRCGASVAVRSRKCLRTGATGIMARW